MMAGVPVDQSKWIFQLGNSTASLGWRDWLFKQKAAHRGTTAERSESAHNATVAPDCQRRPAPQMDEQQPRDASVGTYAGEGGGIMVSEGAKETSKADREPDPIAFNLSNPVPFDSQTLRGMVGGRGEGEGEGDGDGDGVL